MRVFNMILIVTVPDAIANRLRTCAERSGTSPESLAVNLLDRCMEPTKSIDEVLAPIREAFAECNMTDDELCNFFEEVRNEVWQEQQKPEAKES
jgi:hypothetical protein